MIKWFLGLNGHMRTAIILAPFLGIFGYGLADTWLRKDDVEPMKQHVAVREMQLADGCVLDTNRCQLSEDEIKVSLKSGLPSSPELLRLEVSANQHIRGLKMSIVQNGDEVKLVPVATRVTDQWFVEFPKNLLVESDFTLRMALAQTKRVYLAEFAARF